MMRQQENSALSIAQALSLVENGSVVDGIKMAGQVYAQHKLGVHASLYAFMGRGVLRSVKIAGRRLIPVDAIEALIVGGRQ